jgi:hypothetical protein
MRIEDEDEDEDEDVVMDVVNWVVCVYPCFLWCIIILF